MTIAAYCRVSSRRQKADSQVAEIKKWLDAHGYDEAQVVWYIDHETGKTLQRPEFERLQRDIFAGQDRHGHRVEVGPPIPPTSGWGQCPCRLVRTGVEDRGHHATD